jgi:hypothetical protein
MWICGGAVTATSHGYNFADDTTCGFTDSTDTQGAGLDPKLGALAGNGGPAPTMLPATDSPLVDAIPHAACQNDGATGITADERGEARPSPSAGNCDIGAVEVQQAEPPPPDGGGGGGSGDGSGGSGSGTGSGTGAQPVDLVPRFTG